ncbi:MAG: hypothetical protein RMI56_00510 [Sulfolobales archaeon]|nr:hypothetical protein [Sulfolobales archaeon]MDW8082261.1 hypothetical protein [Sulfolobales archaeon]
MPVKIVKVSREAVSSHIVDMTQKGFKCVEIGSGEYSCTKRINEIQDYVVIFLTSPN